MLDSLLLFLEFSLILNESVRAKIIALRRMDIRGIVLTKVVSVATARALCTVLFFFFLSE